MNTHKLYKAFFAVVLSGVSMSVRTCREFCRNVQRCIFGVPIQEHVDRVSLTLWNMNYRSQAAQVRTAMKRRDMSMLLAAINPLVEYTLDEYQKEEASYYIKLAMIERDTPESKAALEERAIEKFKRRNELIDQMKELKAQIKDLSKSKPATIGKQAESSSTPAATEVPGLELAAESLEKPLRATESVPVVHVPDDAQDITELAVQDKLTELDTQLSLCREELESIKTYWTKERSIMLEQQAVRKQITDLQEETNKLLAPHVETAHAILCLQRVFSQDYVTYCNFYSQPERMEKYEKLYKLQLVS